MRLSGMCNENYGENYCAPTHGQYSTHFLTPNLPPPPTTTYPVLQCSLLEEYIYVVIGVNMFFGPLFLILVYLGQTTLMTLASLFALIVIACSFGIGGHMLGKALKKMGGKNPKVFEKGQRVIKTARIIISCICLLLLWSLLYTIFGEDYTTLAINNLKITCAYMLMNTCTSLPLFRSFIEVYVCV